jgi:hypothetical protein
MLWVYNEQFYVTCEMGTLFLSFYLWMHVLTFILIEPGLSLAVVKLTTVQVTKLPL